MLEGRYDDAADIYRGLVGEVSDERSAEALLHLAELELDFRGDAVQGESVLRELVARFPRSKAAHRGQLRLVELYRDRIPDPVRLVPATLRAMDMNPSAERLPWLRLVLAEGYLGRGDYDQARIEIDNLLEAHPDAAQVPRARLLAARSFELRGSIVEALDAYREVERRFVGTEVSVEARLGRARMLENLDDLDAAEAVYLECLGYASNRPAVGERLRALRERRERRLAGAPQGL
jgi:TolA-binding protein